MSRALIAAIARLTVSTFSCDIATAHDLHVLLRHRLLLQAEVGEGVRAVHVDDVPDDLAVADLVKRGDLPLSRIKLDAAGLAAARDRGNRA